MKHAYLNKLFVLLFILALPPGSRLFAQQQTVARQWNEALLFSIERDFSRPTVHARNLFHVSVAMYDAWAAYDDTASTYFLGKTLGDFTCDYEGIPIPATAGEIKEARKTAISYACYRILKQRFQFSPGAALALPYYDSLMTQFGYPTDYFSQDYQDGDAAALGNYIAAKIIEFGFVDGSNQQGNYANLYYETVNPQIIVNEPGNPTLDNPNRWQAIFLDGFVDQSGNLISISPPFLSAEWGDVVPFAMDESHMSTYQRDGFDWNVYMDPGAPPYIDTTVASGLEDIYKFGFLMVNNWQSHHDTADAVMIDISPGSIGNIQYYPETFEEFPDFYDWENGGDPGEGYDVNPYTGLPYEPQLVHRADYARVLAEFWADGPNSETPPGHWFTILNYVSDHPLFEMRWMGQGPILDSLEWNVRTYFTMGGSMHDAAIAAWSAKGYYDYPRPVSIIRWMADKGQSTDSNLPHYHPAGVPLMPGKIELVMPGDELAGDNDENLYKIKLWTWRGHYFIDDPLVDQAGVGWILAENWWPYQRPNFVTPPFAGYISGHSTYSRTAAEVMTMLTGDEYFPGGMGEFFAPMNEFLKFEEGPSQDVTLQWAKYRDASDQCSLSRIWGGIHPPQDDMPGRRVGMELAPLTFEHASQYILAGIPVIASSEINYQTVTNQLPSDLIITVHYNDMMNQNIFPQISFTNNIPAGLISTDYFIWTDAQTGEFHLTVGNEELEITGVGISVSGAEDVDGNLQQIYVRHNWFDVDTDIPNMVNGVVSAQVVNTDLIGNSTVQVEVNYDQAMDMNVIPSVSFESPIPVQSLSENAGVSSWTNDTTFVMYLDVANLEEECPGVILHVTGAEDLNGNTQEEGVLNMLVDIDTKRPQASFLSANAYVITQEFIDVSPVFSIISLFDEQMNTDQNPEVSFVSSDNLGAILLPNQDESTWLNPFNYKSAFDVSPVVINITDIGVSVSAARDAAGNEMISFSEEDFFSINLDPAKIKLVSNHGQIGLYPNPVKAGLPVSFDLPENVKNFSAEIFDHSGKTVLLKSLKEQNIQSGKFVISTSGFAAGVYTARIVSDERSEVVRLVVVQ